MLYNIRMRLIPLGRKQADLIPELAKRGIRANQTEVSQALNGRCQQPKADRIREAAYEIIKEWERS